MNSPATDGAEHFAEVARGFCAWVEGPSLGQNERITAAVWLARLHAAALVLPAVDSENENDLPSIPVSELVAAKAALGVFSGIYYRECFDPDPSLTEEPVMGDVGDDMLDTYQDIKRGLLVFDLGQAQEALWHWSFLHSIHWGRHAVGAMLALHCLPGSEHK